MNVDTLPPPVEVFRSSPVRGLPDSARVDRKSMRITGVKAMQVGRLNEGDARPWKADMTTLEQLTELVNNSNRGVKVRFSHPNMSRDGMGRHLGRAMNARIEGEGEDAAAYVDIQLVEAAKRTPNGNLAEHVLDMAEDAPDMFGMSIAPILDRDAMESAYKDEKKQRVDDGHEPIRMSKLRAIDFVDEPAATRGGLFSLDSDSLADLPAQATWLLDTFFEDASPDVVTARFNEFVRSYFAGKGLEMADPQNTESEETKVEDLGVEQEQPETDSANASESADLGQQNDARDELKRRAEIGALCKLAKVDDETKGLLLSAGFSRSEAQEYLRDSGHLSRQNPPVSEGADDESKKKTPEDIAGEEFDKFEDIYTRQGLSREDYIASRVLDN